MARTRTAPDRSGRTVADARPTPIHGVAEVAAAPVDPPLLARSVSGEELFPPARIPDPAPPPGRRTGHLSANRVGHSAAPAGVARVGT